jgi:hypothetical protein
MYVIPDPLAANIQTITINVVKLLITFLRTFITQPKPDSSILIQIYYFSCPQGIKKAAAPAKEATA